MSAERTTSAVRIPRECLALRVKMVNRVITKIYDDALRPLGIRVTQAAMLAFALERGVLRQSELCAELQLDDSTMSRNLERLCSQGWLEPVTESSDARQHPYRLTRKGAALLERVMPRWEAAQQRARQLLGADGVSAVRAFASAHGLHG